MLGTVLAPRHVDHPSWGSGQPPLDSRTGSQGPGWALVPDWEGGQGCRSRVLLQADDSLRPSGCFPPHIQAVGSQSSLHPPCLVFCVIHGARELRTPF